MKKFLLFILFFLFSTPVFAQSEISFVYLNGSNTNTKKAEDDFIKGVYKFHNQIYLNFSNDPFIKNNIFKNIPINDTPIPFYWGDMSKKEIEFIQNDFNIIQKISPKPAQFVRKFIALCLHDAIWVSRTENMYPIVEKLHAKVMEEYNKGNKIVLVGYSAGTFIAHEYLFLKMPVINIKESVKMSDNTNDEFKNYIISKDLENTCADAIFKSKLVGYDVKREFIFEDNIQSFKNKIDSLNSNTLLYCAPKDALLGGINFASPFALFYSGIFNPEYKMSEIMAHTYKFIVENNMFWLTVNYSDDPLGFPNGKNVTVDELDSIIRMDIKPNGGFIFEKSDKPSGRTFFAAHLSYFNTAKRYSKILVRALKDGYCHFYMTNTQ